MNQNLTKRLEALEQVSLTPDVERRMAQARALMGNLGFPEDEDPPVDLDPEGMERVKQYMADHGFTVQGAQE